MKILVCGSREFEFNYEFMWQMDNVIGDNKDITIISGGARGADKLAENYAKLRNLKSIVVPAKWDVYGRSAGYRRNIEMLNMLDTNDLVIAFQMNKSKGTQHTIDNAKMRGIKTIVFEYNSNSAEFESLVQNEINCEYYMDYVYSNLENKEIRL